MPETTNGNSAEPEPEPSRATGNSNDLSKQETTDRRTGTAITLNCAYIQRLSLILSLIILNCLEYSLINFVAPQLIGVGVCYYVYCVCLFLVVMMLKFVFGFGLFP